MPDKKNPDIGKKSRDVCLVYLADLVHNYASKGPHTFPVNIGYIAAYAKKVFGGKVQIKLFKFPSDLISAVKQKKPDIVGLSNYTWNLDINNRVVAWIKSFSPGIVTVCGGPDYPVAADEAARYLAERPQLDFYVINQGERGFANILKRYFECGSAEKMKSTPIDNCVFYDKNRKAVISGSYKYVEDLEEIPSPYLEGLMDEFFGKNLIPLIETNRGCPYHCTYCAWGKSSQRKIFLFPLERIRREIEYIAERIGNIDLLMLGDANFGMFDRDVEIARFLRHAKDSKGYPRDIFAAWAKTNTDNVINMIGILGDMIGTSSAFGSFQTMDPVVTANIKRVNIPFGKFREIQDRLGGMGIFTSTELILGLPGETKETHIKGLRDLFDYNAAAIVCYNLRMLSGSELDMDENRKRFAINTKFRLIDGGFGRYDGIISIEHEEMVLGTATMAMEDILYFRPIHFIIQFLWNLKYYREILCFLKLQDVNPIDFVIKLIDSRNAAPDSVKRIFEEFMDEAYAEWFDTKEKLFEHYSKPENFDFISRGGFGKLNYKYAYRILLECKADFDKYVFAVAEDMLSSLNKLDGETKKQLDDLFRFTSNAFVDFNNFFKGLPKEKTVEFEYDILKWRKGNCRGTLSSLRSPHLKLRFEIPDEQSAALKKLLDQFRGADINQTLRKMVEYINERDLFYKIEYG